MAPGTNTTSELFEQRVGEQDQRVDIPVDCSAGAICQSPRAQRAVARSRDQRVSFCYQGDIVNWAAMAPQNRDLVAFKPETKQQRPPNQRKNSTTSNLQQIRVAGL